MLKKIIILLCLIQFLWPVSHVLASVVEHPVDYEDGAELSSATGQEIAEYLDDDMVDVENWRGVGRHAIGYDQKEGSSFLQLKIDEDNPVSSLQATEDDDGQILPLETQYTYLIDFSLEDFAIGDAFEVVINRETPELYQAILCTYTYRSGGTLSTFLCGFETVDLLHDQINTHYGFNLVTNELPGEAVTNNKVYTLRLTRNRSGLTIALWQKDHPERALLRQIKRVTYFAHMPDTPSLEQPIVMIRKSLLHDYSPKIRLYRYKYAHLYQPISIKSDEFVHFSQRDSLWREDLLGHSQELTLGNYGCLLTSAAMILRYHI